MRKISALFLLTLVAVLTLSGCNLASNTKDISEQDVYALSVFSMGELLGSSQTSTTIQLTAASTLEEEPITTDTDPVLEKYLAMMETFLNSGAPIQANTTVSDREGYAFMTVYQVRDLLGGIVSYTIYFNEILPEVVEDEPIETDEPEVETPETEAPLQSDEATIQSVRAQQRDRNHEHDGMFEDESDDEIVYELEGLLIVDDIEYRIVGRKEIEDDETEIKFVAFTDMDNFIRISYKTEENEQKFVLVQRVDGQVVQRTSIKVDSEDGESKVMLTYQTGTQIARYSFKEVDNENYDIFIKYDIREAGSIVERGMIKIKITVDEETGETNYTYQVVGERKGHTFEGEKGFGRNHHGDYS
ncbi:lipoprotein [Acholeplasma vituli]|uniref:Lipoprotein n=1 Tax=Paracholeplasma vituli TaxID=69473 RepID=A0ABT2PUM9_9MOLU|nr:lipoprotein [Paracholeplasma vituli]MCU0104655.1 lipoprotein [Paracholeplasma vituli]